MTHVLRAASQDDLPAIYEMAKSTGGGFTNLPADRPKLQDKLDTAAASFARNAGDAPDDLASDMYMFVLEDLETGKVRGTCQIFSCIGTDRPHYSYRIDAFTHYSSEFSRAIRSEMLTLVTDHNGSSEVGGLFLHPTERSAGAGSLLARSRYLFMAMHRARFADRTLAELRGVIDEVGVSPFWDGVTGRFFGMSFREADEFKAVRGAQFIADLMPKHPIYTAMVPESAMAVMGIPHPSGRAAQRMLEKEGFAYRNYIDVFDGGPTMVCTTDEISTIRHAQQDMIVAVEENDGTESLIAHGRLEHFRAAYGRVKPTEGGIVIDAATAGAIQASAGQVVTHIPR
jgi:arginine N-succinyltransferase